MREMQQRPRGRVVGGAVGSASGWMVRVAALIVCWLVTAGVAQAEGSILFVGKVAPRERDVIRATIEATATPLGWTFGERQFADADSAAILACLQIDRPGTCVGRILQQNGVQQLAVVQVSTERGEDGRPQVVVTQQVVVPGADVVFINRRTCEQCDDASLRHHVAAMTTKLLQDAASGSSTTFLAIRSTPAGAWITLDGDTAGATDATIATYPGKHTVMLRAAGYDTVVQDVDAAEGKTTELALTLRANGTPAGSTDDRPGARSRLPWLVLGAGGAAVLTGVVLFALDEDLPPASQAQPRRYFESATAGVAIGAAGLAVVGVCTYLLLRSPAPTAGPRVSLSPDHAAVGWAGVF